MHYSHGFVIGVSIFFVVGTGLNVWRHAASVVNSSLNGIGTYRQYFKIYGADQAFKSFGALCFLMWWSFNQIAVESLTQQLWPSRFGAAPGWLLSVESVNPATAGAFGLGWDVLLDLVLVYLRKKFPQLNRDVKPTPEATTEKKAS